MSKIELIRNTVLAADEIEADQLITLISDGKIVTTATSVTYKAKAIVAIIEWKGDIHKIAWALGEYLRNHEPDQPRDALEFETEIISHPLVDVTFTLPFTERVVVEGSGDTVEAETCTKPITDPADLDLLGSPTSGGDN